MRFGIASLLWLCLSFGAWPLAAAEPVQIHIVSEVWEDHTNADGSGLAWDIARTVFEPTGVLVKAESMPYTRSVGLVQRGQADAWIGAYPNEVSSAVFPRWHYDIDPIYALGLVNSPSPTLDTLGVYRLIWLRGYDYQDQLPNVRNYKELQSKKGVLEMLKNHRADFYLDAEPEVRNLLTKAEQPALYSVTLLASLPVYFGFAPGARGQQLADLFDRRMAELVKSGELKPLFQRWKQPYPFNKESP